jgi:hypothetical protein
MHLIRCTGILFFSFFVSSLMCVLAAAQSSSLRERIFADPVTELNKAISVAEAENPNFEPDREITVNWCHVYAEWGETRDDDFLEHFEHIAQEHVRMRHTIHADGYPPEAYRNELAGVTTRYLREIVRRRDSGLDLRDNPGIKRAILPFERGLAERLNAHRERFDRALAQPHLWEQCGGDYIGYVKLRAEPGGATIRLIREFYYKFCQATGIPPLSDGCDKWTVIPSTRDVPGGTYYYIVSWPNGHTECDRIQFFGASPAEDDKTITINQSGKGCER